MSAPSELDAPKTLTESGKPPETRLGDAKEVHARVHTFIKADQSRAQRRAMVKGLVDGNPPYRASDLRNAGRADACNVNWRVAESYLYSARNAFYDLRSEVPTFATVRCGHGTASQRKVYSDVLTEEFQRTILAEDKDFDYEMQISDHEMTLYGSGPQMFEDPYDFRSVAVPHMYLFLPEFALSRPNKWEEASALVKYAADHLYKMIRNEKAANDMGWQVAAVKDAIIKAHPKSSERGIYETWEWHQQQLKNNSAGYAANSTVITCGHYFVREFPEAGDEDFGKITHAIVLLNENKEKQDFLFKHVRRFPDWSHIHPFYYDNDGGGYHHSVTGLGVKMYSAMEFQNRLLCNMADKAFAPKVFFRALTANANEMLDIIKMGDWAKVPSGFEAIQTPVGSFLEEPLALHREMQALIASNLSQYRQNLSKTQGNPLTATEVEMRASEQARLGKTQLSHYFGQCDAYYAEKYRRLAHAKNKNLPGGRAAMDFQKRCQERNVPVEAMREPEYVGATRIAGQGSPYLRQQAMMQLLSTSQLNPSSAGRMNIYSDYVASTVGQMLVERYVPEIVDFEATDQKAIAVLQVAAARNGVQAVFSPNQAHVVFAETFFEAIGTAFESLGQGADPQQVHSFVDALGGALIRHIEAIGQDPRNAKIAKAMEQQWKQVAAMMDKLAAQIQQQQQQQAQQMQMRQQAMAAQNGGDPEMQLKAAETRGKLALQKQKQDATLQMKSEKEQHNMALTGAKARQDLAIADAKAASEISIQQRKAEAAETSPDN